MNQVVVQMVQIQYTGSRTLQIIEILNREEYGFITKTEYMTSANIFQIILAEIGYYLRRVKHSLFDEMIVANTLSQNYTGGDLAPYWNLYRQHFNSSVPINILQSLRIGSLHPDDIAALEKEKEKKPETEGDDDPYNNDPALSPLLTYHMTTPINAEPPGSLLTADWITPSELWFARNHHPVPPLQDKNASQLQLTIDVFY